MGIYLYVYNIHNPTKVLCAIKLIDQIYVGEFEKLSNYMDHLMGTKIILNEYLVNEFISFVDKNANATKEDFERDKYKKGSFIHKATDRGITYHLWNRDMKEYQTAIKSIRNRMISNPENYLLLCN